VQEALEVREERYRALVESMSEGLVLADEEDRATYVNRAFCEMIDYSAEELLGRPPELFFDDESRQRYLKEMEGRRRGSQSRYELSLRRKDGKRVVVQASGRPIQDADGTFRGSVGILTELTERKRAEEALASSEKSFRTLVELMNEGVARTDTRGVITYVNPWFCALLGYSAGEFLGRAAEDFVDERDRQRYLDQVPARRAGQHATYELGLRRKDGRRVDVLLSSRPVFDDSGDFCGALAVFTDISERKRVEEDLNDANSELRAIFDAYPDLSFRLSADGTMLDFRKGLTTEMYLPPNRFIGRKPADYLPAAVGEQFRNAIEEVHRTRSMVTIEYNLPIAGKEQSLEGRFVPLPNGEILLLIRNISVRKRTEEALAESEERYRTLVESIHEGLGTMDEHGISTYVNPRLCEMVGFSAEELVGQTPIHFFDEESRRRFFARAADRQRGIADSYELILRKKSGEPVPVLISEQPLFDKNGAFRGICSIITDISAQKRAEERLSALSARLLKAHDEERQSVAHELHDDFGQLLAGLKFAVHRLRKHLPADRPDLGEIGDQLHRDVETAIHKMRTLHRGLHPSELEHLGLASAVETLVGDFQERTGIACSLEWDDSSLTLGREQQLHLYRIVQEALTNVARHADAAEVEVKVRVEPSQLCIEVQDDGCGMDPERASAPTSYGLTGMRKRAEYCGGRLHIRSEPGEGTMVRVEVPLLSPAVVEVQCPEPAGRQMAPEGGDPARRA